MMKVFTPLLFLIFSGCLTPMMHPLRVEDGPVAQVSVAANLAAGRQGRCDNDTGCTDNDRDLGFLGLQLLQFGAGWGHVAFDHVGMMGGIYFPAHVNQKRTQLDSLAALWSYFTFQTEHFAIGVGPEVGSGGWAVSGGVEGRIPKLANKFPFPLSLGAYGRRSIPWEEVSRDFNGKIAANELGVRLGLHYGFLEYSYYMQDRGVQNFVIYETSVYAAGFHIISIGLDVGAILREEFGW